MERRVFHFLTRVFWYFFENSMDLTTKNNNGLLNHKNSAPNFHPNYNNSNYRYNNYNIAPPFQNHNNPKLIDKIITPNKIVYQPGSLLDSNFYNNVKTTQVNHNYCNNGQRTLIDLNDKNYKFEKGSLLSNLQNINNNKPINNCNEIHNRNFDNFRNNHSHHGYFKNGKHNWGKRNLEVEKSLFGDSNSETKSGINFEKYNDIPVEATGKDVPPSIETVIFKKIPS